NNSNNFVPIETPILTKNFAGIGTREINENGKQAIRDVYEKTTGIQITPQQKQLSSFTEKTITVKKDDKSNWTLIVKPDGSVINANNNKEITDERLINKARLKAKFYNYRVVENVNGIRYAITDDNRVFTLAETSMGKEISKDSSTYTNIIVKGYAPNFYNKYKNTIKSIDEAENYIKDALKKDRENTLNKLKDCF
ncbi:MAG TPA: hypothetical protein VIK84_04885, partial [Haloplasmataceae bacterium]